MAYLTRLVYLIIVLSIAADLLSLGDYLLSTGRRDGDATAVQSSLFIPGASALWGLVGRAVSKASKSAMKAAKKRDKEKARKEGNARNAAKKGRRGMLPLHLLINSFPCFSFTA